jgi:hypothetical protein
LEILDDLHQLGIIIFLNEKILRDTVICNPKWFNLVFKKILDFGRKKIELSMENYEILLRNYKNTNMKSVRAQIKDFLEWVKCNSNLSIQEIWRNEKEINKTIVNKVSFQKILGILENVEIFVSKNSDIVPLHPANKIHLVNQEELYDIIEQITGGDKYFNPQKISFVKNILLNFNFLLPKKREFSIENLLEKQEFIVPLLFANLPPLNLQKYKQKKRNFEWKINYQLSFEPSSIFKTVFLRLRQTCTLSYHIKEEFYWERGFLFII